MCEPRKPESRSAARRYMWRVIPKHRIFLRLPVGLWAILAWLVFLGVLVPTTAEVRGNHGSSHRYTVFRFASGYAVIPERSVTDTHWSAADDSGEGWHCWFGEEDSLAYPVRERRVVRVQLTMPSGWDRTAVEPLLAGAMRQEWGPPVPVLSSCVQRAGQNSQIMHAQYQFDLEPWRIAWWGVLANALLLGSGCTTCYFSMWWFFAFRDCRRLARRWRALENGRCPKCRYDIRDLPERRCPECGAEWKLEEVGMKL